MPTEAPADLQQVLLTDDPVLVALPSDHALARRRTLRLAELAGEHWIAAPLAGLPLDELRAAARTAGFQPALHFDGDDFHTVLALVAAGVGVALLPRLALRQPPPGVVVAAVADAPVTRLLHVARRRSGLPAPATDALERELLPG